MKYRIVIYDKKNKRHNGVMLPSYHDLSVAVSQAKFFSGSLPNYYRVELNGVIVSKDLLWTDLKETIERKSHLTPSP